MMYLMIFPINIIPEIEIQINSLIQKTVLLYNKLIIISFMNLIDAIKKDMIKKLKLCHI